MDESVTLINRFTVTPDRDDEFLGLWTATSAFFRQQPGFVSLRLHRAVSADAEHRWVNVATWASAPEFRAAHAAEGFRRLVAQPAWRQFPSSPTLYELVTSAG